MTFEYKSLFVLYTQEEFQDIHFLAMILNQANKTHSINQKILNVRERVHFHMRVPVCECMCMCLCVCVCAYVHMCVCVCECVCVSV